MESTSKHSELEKYYRSSLAQSLDLALPEPAIRKAIFKISNSIHNEGDFMQFALDPSTQQKAVLALKPIKAFGEVFLIQHVSTFKINGVREMLETNQRARPVFEAIATSADLSGVDTLKNQKSKFGDVGAVLRLRQLLSKGRADSPEYSKH